MTGSDTGDRRKKPRIPRRLPVRFGTEARMCGGAATDISEGGIRVESSEGFPVNSIVQVFVQFPRHSLRLRARVAWVGGGGEGGGPRLGLALTQPEPTLVRAYQEWQAEIKLAEKEAAGGPQAAARPAPAGAPAPAPEGTAKGAAPQAAQPAPKGPIKRRLETRRGNAYDVLIEPAGGGWRLLIAQVPRQIGVGAADHDETYGDFAAADRALKEFIRDH